MSIKTADNVLDFWFYELTPDEHFAKNQQIDDKIYHEFFETWRAAANGELAHWRESYMGRLAEIIVLDQFSRNLWRNSPVAFAQDGMALVLSQEALTPEIENVDPNIRQFFLMPMMHSESLKIQQTSLPLFQRFCTSKTNDFAKQHHDIIARFGRFPHRNKVLNRTSTPEEIEFLKEPLSFF